MIHRIFDKSIFEKEIMEVTTMFRNKKIGSHAARKGERDNPY